MKRRALKEYKFKSPLAKANGKGYCSERHSFETTHSNSKLYPLPSALADG